MKITSEQKKKRNGQFFVTLTLLKYKVITNDNIYYVYIYIYIYTL
jgi:hypothetical protein